MRLWSKKLTRILAVALTLSLMLSNLPLVSFAVESAIYVDPVNGSDTNAGTSEGAALRTIEAAKVIAAQMSESSDVTVYLKGGTYSVTEPIRFGAEDSGKNGYTITYKAAPGETPVISGGMEVTGWTLYDAENSIYAASIPEEAAKSRQFYVNGEHQDRAMLEESPVEWQIMGSGGYVSPAVNDTNTNEALVLDLGEMQDISALLLYTNEATDENGKAAGFPKDFTIEVSDDNTVWNVVRTVTDYAAPAVNTTQMFTFTATQARYVKLNVTELGTPAKTNTNKYFLSLSEIGVAKTSTRTAEDLEALEIAQHVDFTTNILDPNKVTFWGASESNPWVDTTLPFNNLIDGDKNTYIATKGNYEEWLTGNGGSMSYKLAVDVSKSGLAVSVAAVEIGVMRNAAGIYGQPTSFEIQVAASANAWKTVYSVTDYDWGTEDSAVITFNPAVAKYVRLVVHDIGTKPEWSNDYVLLLREMAIYKPADIAKGAAVTAPNSWEYPEGNLSKDNLTKGVIGHFYTSNPVAYATALEAPITLNLGTVQSVAGVRLYPRTGNVHYVKGMTVETSENGETYTKVLELSDIVAPQGDSQFFVFPDAVNAQYIRITPTEIQNGEKDSYRFQLFAIEVAPEAVEEETSSGGEAEEPAVEPVPHSYTVDTTKSVISNLPAERINFWGLSETSGTKWVNGDLRNLTDGNKTTMVRTNGYTPGATSNWFNTDGSLKYKPGITMQISANGEPVAISAVAISALLKDGKPYCQPTAFTVEVADTLDATEYTTVLTVDNCDWGTNDTVLYSFDTVSACKVRIIVNDYDRTIPAFAPIYSATDCFCMISEVALYKVENIVDSDKVTFLGGVGTSNAQYPYIQNYPMSNLTDGDKSTFIAAMGTRAGWGLKPSLTIDTSDANGFPVSISAVEFSVPADPNGIPYGQPVKFDIQVSRDGGDWQTVVSKEGYDWGTNTTAVFTFTPVKANKVRLYVHDIGTVTPATSGGNGLDYHLTITEFAIFKSQEAVIDPPVVYQQKIDTSKNLLSGLPADNIYFWGNNEASSNQYVNKTGLESLGIAYAYLTDGDKNTGAATNGYQEAWLTSMAPGLRLQLTTDGSPVAVSAVSLSALMKNGKPYAHPTSFDIEVDPGTGTYTTVLQVENYDWGTSNTAVFAFDTVAASTIRIKVKTFDHTKPSWSNDLHCIISEVAVYKAANIVDYNKATLYGGTTNYVDTTYPMSNLTDGNKGTFISAKGVRDGWLSGETGGSMTQSLTVDLTDAKGNPTSISAVEFSVPADSAGKPYGEPTNFEIQVSVQEGKWKTIANESAYDWGGKTTAIFSFEPMQVNEIRILVKDLGTKTPGSATDYHLRFTEFAAYMSKEEAAAPEIEEEKSYGNPVPSNIQMEGGFAMNVAYRDIVSISALNDNTSASYNALKAIDGHYYNWINHIGYSLPESYDFEQVGNVDDVELHIIRNWYHRILPLGSVSADGTEVYFDDAVVSQVQGSTWSDRITWVENAYEFIDEAGEWYIDRDTNTIYYKPYGDMSDVAAVLPVAEKVLIVDGCENVTFDGITFRYTTWTVPNDAGYIDAQSGTYETGMGKPWSEMPGGIEIGDSTNVKITNCDIGNFGAGGIRILNGSQGTEITNSAIHDISGGGIWVGSIHGHGSTCEEGSLIKDTLIRNNYVTRIGLDIFDSTGITVLYTEETVVDHNEISYTPYSGINLGWGWASTIASCAKNNTISNNYIHHTGLTSHDGGCIYTLGSQPGSKIYGNYLHNHNNGQHSQDCAIYLDEGSSYIEVYDNVIGDGVYWWSFMWTSTIHDNHWHDNFHQVRNERDDGTNNTVENNTYVPEGNFADYPKAAQIIENAGLLNETAKDMTSVGISYEHNIVLEQYPQGNSYYLAQDDGLVSFRFPGQTANTQYNWVTHEIEILMPQNTDVTTLAPDFVLEAGWTADKASGTAQDFTSPVVYTFTKGSSRVTWTVTVKVGVEATGTITGTEMTLDNAIANPGDWTMQPTVNEDGSLTFSGTFSGYIGEELTSDTILKFDMSSCLKPYAKDWMGYALCSQNTSAATDTMYHVCIARNAIELQKWVDGERTMLYGTIDGYTPVFGDLPNDFFTEDERHSIMTGAITVEGGVRLFLYIDGNKVFDVVDADNPLSTDGYFVVYPMTQDITLYNFSNIERIPADTTELEAAIADADIAKSGIEVIDGKTTAEVTKDTTFVTTAEMTALTDAIAAAEAALSTVTTEEEVAAAVAALNNAINTFKAAIKTGTYVAVNRSITANGKSLTLNGLVFVNHYGKFSGFEDVDRAYIEENGGLLTWSSAVNEDEAVFGYGNPDINEGLTYDRTYDDGGEDYKAQTDGVPMAEYADELYFRIYVKMPDGSYMYGPLQVYSVQKYCENKLNDEDAEESLKNLCAAVLHFGAAAQVNFEHNTDDMANANILNTWPAEDFDRSLLTDAADFTTSISNSKSVKENGKSLVLNGEIQMKYYFKCDFTPASAELLFWQGVEGELSEANVSYRKELTYGNGEYCGYSDGIAFAEYDQTVFACAKFLDADGEAHYSKVIAYSPEVYAKNQLNKLTASKELKELVRRMVICGEYAKQHF